MTKKLFAAIICVMLLAGSASAWNDKYGNDGLSWNTAYTIKSAQDFDDLAGHTSNGAYYKLEADITLSSNYKWRNRSFNGHFDGQDHTISYEFTNNNALFDSVTIPEYSEATAIKNLKVNGAITNSSSTRNGGITERLYAGTIEKCTFTGTIRTSSNYAGGIAAVIENNDSAVIKDCTVSGTFTVGKNIGGIVGRMNGGTIEGCKVLSGTDITTSGGSDTCAGGIVGYMEGGYVRNNNSAASVSQAQYTGAIVGRMGSSVNPGNVSGNTTDGTSSNNGTDTGNNTDSNTGNESGSETNTETTPNTETNNGSGTNNGNGSGEDSGSDDGTEETTADSSDDDSSGCNAGFSVLMLCAGVMAVKFRKR